MSYTIESSCWIARLRAPLLAAAVILVAACDNADSLSPEGSALPPAEPAAEAGPEATPVDAPEFATAFAGGIPIGTSNQPLSQYGSRYNGSLQVIWPGLLRAELATIKARGGKVVLSMAGNEKYYKDGSGHFSMTKWKQRIDRYKGVNFDAYIKDGTIIGHYLLDEPNDPSNWNGQRVSGSTVPSVTWRPASPEVGSTGRTAAASSASRATAGSRSRPATRRGPPTLRLLREEVCAA